MKKTAYEIFMKKRFNESFRKRKVNENFAKARKEVEEKLGINLTLIELVELRKDVEFTSEIYINDRIRYSKGIGGDKFSIRPDFEAALIFMNKNYGTQMYDLYRDFADFDLMRAKLEIELGFDYYPEYFKRVQEEMHFP